MRYQSPRLSVRPILAVFLAALTGLAVSRPGDPDPGFGADGRILVDLRIPAGEGTTQDWATAFAMQADGKILLGGYSTLNGDPDGPEGIDFSLQRLLPDGTPDPSFSGDGMVTTDFNGGRDTIKGIAVQGDGKIVAVGERQGGSFTDLAIARYLADGSLDSSFAGSGQKTFHFGAYESLEDVLIQPDGKILAAGFSDGRITLIRLLENGSPDPGFSADGIMHDKPSGLNCYGYAVKLLEGGRILVGGAIGHSSGGLDAGVACYTPTGELDTSFSGDGWFSATVSGSDGVARALLIQSDGKIVLAGSSGWTSPSDVQVVRLSTEGVPDESFGPGGSRTFPIGSGGDHATAVVPQPDGELLIAGSFDNSGKDRSFLARILDNGSLDPGFGNAGIRISGFTGYRDQVNGLAVLNDGRLLAGGTGNSDFMAARYSASGEPDPSFGEQGYATHGFGISNDSASEVLIQPDGKIVIVGTSHGEFNPWATVSRRLADGSADPDFASGGTVAIPIGSYGGSISSAALQGDGKILLAGASRSDPFGDACLIRFTADGAPDEEFSDDGIAAVRTGNVGSIIQGIAVQADGKIVAAGSARTDNGSDILVLRFLEDGRLDESFADHGRAVINKGLFEETAIGVGLQSDGKIVVCASGSGPSDGGRISLLRLDALGAPDEPFGIEEGMTSTDFAIGLSPWCMAMQEDDRILVGGSSRSGENFDSFVARFTAGGEADLSFSGDGLATYSRTPSYNNSTRALMPKRDGGVVAAASLTYGYTGGFSAISFTPTGELDQSFGQGGVVHLIHGPATEHVTCAAMQADGKIILAGYSHGEHDFDLLAFRIEGSARDAYEAWAENAGLLGFATSPENIVHGDGVLNLFKYAFNLDGDKADRRVLVSGSGTAGTPHVTVIASPGGPVLFRFEFLRRRGSGLDYRVLHSATLEPDSFTPFPGTPVITPIDRYWERVVVENSVPTPSRFAKLEVVIPE